MKFKITLILLILSLLYIGWSEMTKPKRHESKYDKQNAFIESRIYVNENLKAQNKSRYGNTEIGMVDDSTYLVAGDVETVDINGQPISVSYGCKVSFRNDSVFREKLVMERRM